MLYEWAVTGDGAVCAGAQPSGRVDAGLGQGRSAPGLVRPGAWHRLAMVADLRRRQVRFAVDGAVVAELVGRTEAPRVGANEADGRGDVMTSAEPSEAESPQSPLPRPPGHWAA